MSPTLLQEPPRGAAAAGFDPTAAFPAPFDPFPRAAEGPEFGFGNLVGEHPSVRAATALGRKLAGVAGPVLICGPTGTGKELFARGLHYAAPRAREPFVVVNCAAIPAMLLESELFGHETNPVAGAGVPKRGLLELAGAGTLFLDEIGHLPLALQPKLLRALEDRRVRRLSGEEEIEIRCRIVAATNTVLEDEVERGAFREDLFHRLSVYRVDLPRLKDRGGDIELLARFFLGRIAAEAGGEPKRLAGDAVEALHVHGWPGNVRELRNVIQQAALRSDGPVVRAADLLIQRRTSHPATSGLQECAGEIRIPPTGRTLADVEREMIQISLRLTGGNQSAAARMLDVSRATLVRKLSEYNLR